MKRVRIPVLLAMCVLVLPRGGRAQVPSAWFGTWTLNLDKSVYDPGPPPYKRATYRIEPSGDGVKVVYDMVHRRGGVTHLEWTGNLDGHDYTVQGVEEFVTNAYRALGDREWEVMLKIDGRVAARSKVTLSPDGKTITTVTDGRNAQGAEVTTTTVYERAG